MVGRRYRRFKQAPGVERQLAQIVLVLLGQTLLPTGAGLTGQPEPDRRQCPDGSEAQQPGLVSIGQQEPRGKPRDCQQANADMFAPDPAPVAARGSLRLRGRGPLQQMLLADQQAPNCSRNCVNLRGCCEGQGDELPKRAACG